MVNQDNTAQKLFGPDVDIMMKSLYEILLSDAVDRLVMEIS